MADPWSLRIGILSMMCVLVTGAPPGRAQGQDPEAAGVAAEQAGRLKEAFQLYVQALHALPDPPPPEADLRLRERIVKLAPRLDPPPTVPEEAERHAVRAQVMFQEAQDWAGYEQAATQFRKAVTAAPWFAPALFNLALVEEKLGHFDTALRNMKLYLLTAPPDAQEARAKVYELEYRAEHPAQSFASQQLPLCSHYPAQIVGTVTAVAPYQIVMVTTDGCVARFSLEETTTFTGHAQSAADISVGNRVRITLGVIHQRIDRRRTQSKTIAQEVHRLAPSDR